MTSLTARLDSRGVAVIVFAVALLARLPTLGNPLLQIDEQFYLLVGDRILHGAIPYVDIWDRKPVGLFLLFAAMRLLGGAGVWQYQIVSLFFVTGTTIPVFLMARRVAGPGGALASAVLYVLALNCAGGEGGQAPIWYNPLVATAVALIFFARSWTSTASGNFRSVGLIVMMLFGVALQIKYSAVFEGIFAGIALLSLSHARGRPASLLLGDTVLWVLLAIAPTVAAAAVYAVGGHFHEWLFANFVSILERGVERPAVISHRVVKMAKLVTPLVLAVPLRRLFGATPSSPIVREDLRFLDAWAASALLGVVLFGTWYSHYTLPLLAPFAVVAAPLATRSAGRGYLTLLLFTAAISGQIAIAHQRRSNGDAALLDRMTQATKGNSSCLFVYDGPPALYRTTGSCLPTNHIFPSHLQALNEVGATGINEVAEVRAILARRPEQIVSSEPAYAEENLTVRSALYAVLRTHYQATGRYGRGTRVYVIYRLLPAAAPALR